MNIIDKLIIHPDISTQKSSFLSADVAAAAVTVAVADTSGFAADDYIVVGRLGEEKTEIVKIAAVTDALNLSIGALKFAHLEGTPIARIPYNQAKVYSATSETGTFAALAGSPYNLTVDQKLTVVVDTAGTSTTWYKYSYYNSTSTAEGDKSAASLMGTPDMLCTVEDVRALINVDKNNHALDDELVSLIKAATEYIIEETRQQFISKTITGEYHDIAEGQRSVFTNYAPIYGTPTYVEDDEVELTYDSSRQLSDYTIYPGYIKAAFELTPGRQTFRIDYTAYYGTPPAEIVRACAIIAAIKSGRYVRQYQDDQGNISETVATNIPKQVKEALDHYRRIEI